MILGNERELQLAALRPGISGETLAAEEIVTLIRQHIALPGSSRLPVLVVAAAYQAAQQNLRERVLPMFAHTAADKQTGSLGDLEIALVDDNDVVTVYEMKKKKVTVVDIETSIEKVLEGNSSIDNYIFITTEPVSPEVREHANSVYSDIGIEVAVLDCVEFLRHFLLLFYRLRMQFLAHYQAFVLAEPDTAVRQELKVALLAMRQATETTE